MHTLETIQLSKSIKNIKILEDINLKFDNSEIHGLAGQNGSGKTMLFRILSGLVKQSSGRILMDQVDAYEKNSAFHKIGTVIENASMYPEFTGLKNLMFLANINHFIGEAEIRESIRRVGLDPDDRRTVKKYSLGMKQRIAVAQAIMEKPDFLFLDEPTNALDPEGVQLIRGVIREEAERGALVIIASHNMEDIRMLCKQCYHMSCGKLVKEDALS